METVPAPARENRRWLLPLVAILVGALVVFGLLAALAASAPSGSYGWMMGGNWGWMWGLGAIMMLIPLVFLLVLLFALIRPSSPAPTVLSAPAGSDPLREVRLRYARGEITQAQYYQIVNDLERSGTR